jgi:TolB-like protein
LTLATLLTWWWVQPPEQESLDKLSVTVLPFRSDSSDPTTRQLASSLQRRLLLGLSPESNMLSVKGLATEALPDASWDLHRVRSEFRARYALVGEVTQSGLVRRVEARLLDTASNTVAWGDSFDVPQHMANASLDIAAKRITPALVNRIIALEVARVAKAPPRKPDAMDYTLLAIAEASSQRYGLNDPTNRCSKHSPSIRDSYRHWLGAPR